MEYREDLIKEFEALYFSGLLTMENIRWLNKGYLSEDHLESIEQKLNSRKYHFDNEEDEIKKVRTAITLLYYSAVIDSEQQNDLELRFSIKIRNQDPRKAYPNTRGEYDDWNVLRVNRKPSLYQHLIKQYDGAKLIDLVYEHYKKSDFTQLTYSIKSLEQEYLDLQYMFMENFLEESIEKYAKPDKLLDNLSLVFQEVVEDSKLVFHFSNVEFEEERAVHIFTLVCLCLAMAMYHVPNFKAFVLDHRKKKKWWQL
jgi:hypothetical protein